MKSVKKVWGEERWLVNDSYCCKELILKEGYRCSSHYHKNKDEMFYVVSGKVQMEVNDTSFVMIPGDSVRIQPHDVHRFTGLIDSVMIESSTHHEDSDSYRLTESGKA